MNDTTFYLPESFYRAHGLEDMCRMAGNIGQVVWGKEGIEDLDQVYRRDARPTKPLVLYGPDGKTPIIIATAGTTETSELQDLARGIYEKQAAKLDRGEPAIDFARFRERRGLLPADQFDGAFRQALRDRIARHRANPISDPAPNYTERPKGNQYGYQGQVPRRRP